MGKKYTPIAMRCNQEQFDSIKPKLDIGLIEIENLHSFERCIYLVNNIGGHKIVSNVLPIDKKHRNRVAYETWNEQIFLEACGIKTEKQMKISKENIIKLDKKETTVRELFPSVFNTYTGWFRCLGNGNEKWIGYFEESVFKYGIGADGKWFANAKTIHNFKHNDQDVEATNEEVFEALKGEAVRLGIVFNAFVNPIEDFQNSSNTKQIIEVGSDYNFEDGKLYVRGYEKYCVFKDGKFANVIKV